MQILILPHRIKGHYMSLRNDKNMTRVYGRRIHKCQYRIILKHFMTWSRA